MRRAFLFVLDSVGIGAAPDAADYVNIHEDRAVPDTGADTLGHVASACAAGTAEDGRSGPLVVPNLERLGLGHAAHRATGHWPEGLEFRGEATGAYANCVETSRGKDTPSGHWEIAGVPVAFDWGYFPRTVPTFPTELTDALVREAELPGILGNVHASGTQIIAELGRQSVETGRPIVYTSADSVIQIAAHEAAFGLDRLYALCEVARRHVDALNIGRVIARPFIGSEGAFERTGNRRDYAIPPPEPTLLDRAKDDGRSVIAVGKIADIYAHSGPTDIRKANGNDALMDTTLRAMRDARDGDLVMTNFVDFDQLYGHRRDVAGYARALEHFDRRLPEATALMREGDLMLLTADHGCDPSWIGTDHTREQVFALAAGPDVAAGYKGRRETFADIGETVAAHLGLAPGPHGRSFL